MSMESAIIEQAVSVIKMLSSSSSLKYSKPSELFDSYSFEVNKPEVSKRNTDTRTENKDLRFEAIKCADAIKRFIYSDEYIDGEISKTQLYFENLHLQNELLFQESFEKAWIDLFADENTHFLSTFINIASAIDYEWLETKADSLIIAGCAHKDTSVNEAAIRAAESWEQKKHVAYLNMIRKFGISWLDCYKKDVVVYLESL